MRGGPTSLHGQGSTNEASAEERGSDWYPGYLSVSLLNVVINNILLFCFHQSVNLLAMRTREVVKGSHTRKTASFIRVREITNCQDVLQSVTKWYLISNSLGFS